MSRTIPGIVLTPAEVAECVGYHPALIEVSLYAESMDVNSVSKYVRAMRQRNTHLKTVNIFWMVGSTNPNARPWYAIQVGDLSPELDDPVE